jgi:hypothetical protein
MENRAANKLIGRYTASTGVPQEVTVSTGLALDTSTGNLTAAFPPPSAFKNLSIKVASTTTVTVAADFVTTTDGTLYQTTALSGTINLGGNGAVNALDTGTIAIDTWLFHLGDCQGRRYHRRARLYQFNRSHHADRLHLQGPHRRGENHSRHRNALWNVAARTPRAVRCRVGTDFHGGFHRNHQRHFLHRAHGQRRERTNLICTVNRFRDFRNAVECQLDLCLRRGSKFILWNPDKHDKPAAHCSRQNIGRLLGQWEHYFRSGHHTGDCVSRNRDGVLHGMDG